MEATRDLSDADDDSENDDAFDHDLDALRRACLITGADPALLSPAAAAAGDERLSNSDDDDDDLELVRSIRSRFAIPSDALESLSLMPLCTLPPDCSDADLADNDDDDFETLRAIQRRFAAYDNDALKHSPENLLGEKEQVHGSSVSLEKKSSDDMCIHGVEACEEHISRSPACQLGDGSEEQPQASIEWNHAGSSKPSASQPNCSTFPKSAKVFMDAIKKNRSFQKFLRSKLIQIEAKIEENKKLKERVKILKDFEVNCKKRTGRALSQKKDARVQLISGRKAWPSKDLKVHDKKIPAMYCGPVENSHVENYKMALTKFPLSLDRKKWSEAETKNLEKGIQQQFQEMMLQNMVDRLSGTGESREDLNDLDSILISIKNLNITPENIRGFLPKVSWEQVASTYVVGRSGAECETRWLNFEDPLINCNPWTAQEDKNLLFMVQSKGISNWFDISISLGTNRTPFQCLSRYQRSLNVSILKREWTKDDDAKLRLAVETFGECNWQAVASSLEGWTGTQCSNRWKKSLHPAREKVGRWTKDEDKRLTVAQMLFGPRNWKKTAQYVPGRTEVQCRERWVNSLDPSLNWEKWTQEEDSKLREAIAEHGYCWAKVAAALPRRTDNMCRRRWKRLLPHEVPLLQAARRMQKAALICNFVDRESERPAIGPNDFCPLPLMISDENVNDSKEQTKKLRGGLNSGKKKRESFCKVKRKRRQKKSKECSQPDSEAALVISNHGEIEEFDRQETTANQGPEHNTLTKARQCRSSSPLIQMPLRAANGEVLAGLDGRRKNRPRKLHSKRKQLAEADEARECLESQAECVNLTSNSDRTEPLVESNTAKLAKKRRASLKSQNNGNIRTKKTKEHPLSSGKSLLAGDPSDANHNHEDSSCPYTIQPMGITGEEIGTLGGNARLASEKNAGIKQYRKRKKSSEPAGVLQEVSVPVPSEANELNKVKPSSIFVLDQDFGASDEDTPLACLLRNKAKKLKLQANCSLNNQNCPLSINQKENEFFPVRVDMLPAGNIEPSARQDNGLKCFDGGTSVKLSSCTTGKSAVMDTNDEPGRPNLIEAPKAAGVEVMKETVSIGVESSHEISGISLSSFAQNKLDKKRQTSKRGPQTRPPSSLIRGSQLLSKRVNQLHDGNVTCSLNGDLDEPSGLDLLGPVEVALEKSERQQAEDDNEVDDVTLACFLRSKSKKRRFGLAKRTEVGIRGKS